MINQVTIFLRAALILSICCLPSTIGGAQTRPTLRPLEKDYYAGKILLIPADDRPDSLQQPRLIAEIADHDLLTPPIRLLNEAAGLAAWLEEFDYDSVDGVILSLDKFSGLSADARSGIFSLIRSRRPGIPVYAFTTPKGSEDEQTGQLKSSFQLVDRGSIDLLLIAAGRNSISLIRGLSNEEPSASRAEKVILDEDPECATMLLLGRMLNIRFGYVPRFLPVYSLISSNISEPRNDLLKVQNQIIGKVRALGGSVTVTVGQSGGRAESPDLVIFLHTPGTTEDDRRAFVQSMMTGLEKNLRIVLIDLAQNREARESLLQLLRQNRLLDRLAAYAAQADPAETRGEIVTRAIGQASAFLLSIRFLRDDLNRVRRIDRAQIRMLLSRYLSDFYYPFVIRDDLISYARTDLKMNDIRTDDERLVDYATERIRIRAEDLFNEQFRRNIHAILLNTGERAQFEIRLLQRVQARIYPARSSSGGLPVVEITPSIYLVHLGNIPTPLLASQSYWELVGDIDDRILRRWDETNWLRFKVDAESVEMRIKIDEKRRELPESDEGYAIANKLSRGKRRIEITARTPAGAFYAIGKLEQLGIEGKLAGEFQIAEAPALKERAVFEDFGGYWSDRDRAEIMRQMGRNRMNSYFFRPGDIEPDRQRIRKLLREADENFLRLTYVLSTSDQNSAGLDQRMARLAAIGVRHFGLAAGSDARVVEKVTELARGSGAEVAIFPDPWPVVKLCPWETPRRNSPQTLIVRPAENPYLSLAGLANAADFAWQGNSFDSANSFARALELLYDERTLNGIKQWNSLTGACSGQELKNQEIEQKIPQLKAAIEMITGNLESGLLRAELARQPGK